ncbi:hypothetical protein AY601_2834 [Pedobacter cryoconitis]|uniref:Uncharacterized protein n=1 Tax=Pedobacter cryoconitis TaxID=188932 RepID=A0A127VEH5_9SPHI|nr:hypothetical protein AY601_2834 [Pedobacter cryoconitis]
MNDLHNDSCQTDLSEIFILYYNYVGNSSKNYNLNRIGDLVQLKIQTHLIVEQINIEIEIKKDINSQ